MLLRLQVVLPIQEPAVWTHLGGVIFGMIPERAVPKGLTLKQMNLEEVENHQVSLKVEDVVESSN